MTHTHTHTTHTHTHTHTHTQVKAILVNIFGGIVDCTTIANGIVGACREIQLRMPLVVRLEGVCVRDVCVSSPSLSSPSPSLSLSSLPPGTNSAMARQILADSGLPIQAASDLSDAANKVVASLKS